MGLWMNWKRGRRENVTVLVPFENLDEGHYEIELRIGGTRRMNRDLALEGFNEILGQIRFLSDPEPRPKPIHDVSYLVPILTTDAIRKASSGAPPGKPDPRMRADIHQLGVELERKRQPLMREARNPELADHARRQAVEALGVLARLRSDVASRKVILELLLDSSPTIRRAALLSTLQFADEIPSALPTILTFLDDQLLLAEALIVIPMVNPDGSETFLELLERAQNTRDTFTRRQLLEALNRFDWNQCSPSTRHGFSKRLEEALEKIPEKDREPGVRALEAMRDSTTH